MADLPATLNEVAEMRASVWPTGSERPGSAASEEDAVSELDRLEAVSYTHLTLPTN